MPVDCQALLLAFTDLISFHPLHSSVRLEMPPLPHIRDLRLREVEELGQVTQLVSGASGVGS